jgi:hypothetical protein
MRSIGSIVISIALFAAGSAAAQGWIEFVSEEEMFGINMPGMPEVEDITYLTEYRIELPAKVFTARDENTVYKMTVVDFSNTPLGGERALWDFYGSVAHAATNIRQRGGEIIHDGWGQSDRIPGHQLAINNGDGTRSYYQLHSHGERLFIAEATGPADATPPINFQQSLIILDEDGEIVRYDTDLRTRVDAGR